MKFDKDTSCDGVEIYTEIKNGKAFLEWKFYVCEAGSEQEPCLVRLQLYRQDGVLTAECFHCISEEENVKTLILHPNLWEGLADPYQYYWCAYLCVYGKGIVDKREGKLSLCTFCHRQGKGWFLNDNPFEVRAVTYHMEGKEVKSRGAESMGDREVRQELKYLREMGANTICANECRPEFIAICEEMGFVVWFPGSDEGEYDKNFSKVSFDEIFDRTVSAPTERFYFYKARWSTEPFVHIERGSLQKQKNGLYKLRVYSNRKKVALYIDGILFGFLSGENEFLFEDLPAKAAVSILTVEAEECCESVTFSQFTDFSQLHHFSMTINS